MVGKMPANKHICHASGIYRKYREIMANNGKYWQIWFTPSTFRLVRTSDGGIGNHSVSLPIILIKIKVDQMLPSSYISSLLVSILWFCIWFPISINVLLYFGAKMVTFCIIHIGNRKIFLKHPPPPLLVSILWFCIWFPISINVLLYQVLMI